MAIVASVGSADGHSNVVRPRRFFDIPKLKGFNPVEGLTYML